MFLSSVIICYKIRFLMSTCNINVPQNNQHISPKKKTKKKNSSIFDCAPKLFKLGAQMLQKILSVEPCTVFCSLLNTPYFGKCSRSDIPCNLHTVHTYCVYIKEIVCYYDIRKIRLNVTYWSYSLHEICNIHWAVSASASFTSKQAFTTVNSAISCPNIHVKRVTRELCEDRAPTLKC